MISDNAGVILTEKLAELCEYNGYTPVEHTFQVGADIFKQTFYIENGTMQPLDYTTAEGDLKNAIAYFRLLMTSTSISTRFINSYAEAFGVLIENGIFGDDFYKTAAYPNHMLTIYAVPYEGSTKVQLYNYYSTTDETKKTFVIRVTLANGSTFTRRYNTITKTFDDEYITYTSEPLALTASKATDTPTLTQLEMAAAPTKDMQIATKKYVDEHEVIIASSTAGSTKKFKITVDDSGAITATEVTSA